MVLHGHLSRHMTPLVTYRKAIVALRIQCEGLPSSSLCKQQAYKRIVDSHCFGGKRTKFSSTDIVTMHQEAHNKLQEYNESIAEGKRVTIYSQIDEEENHHVILKELVDHKSYGSAVKVDNSYIVSKNGTNWTRRLTTEGWKLLVEWRDGSVSWEPLKDLKESSPLQVAEYAVVANKIIEELAFGTVS
jgi:hypothetical protein